MKNKLIINLLFTVYSLLMIWLLFIQRIEYVTYENYLSSLSDKINLVPFKTIIEYINTDNATFRHAFINLAGNVVMFIPLGFFLPFLNIRCTKFPVLILYSVLIILIIELIQLFTLTGSFDVDDLILNTIGSAIGGIFKRLIFKNKH